MPKLRLLFSILVLNFLVTGHIYAEVSESLMQERSKLIKRVWQGLNKETMHLVDEFYDDEIHFVDSVGELRGKENMRKYYEGLYKNVTSVKFDIYDEMVNGNRHVIFWRMTLETKKLNGGKPIVVEGSSIMKFSEASGKVIYHRDYFDIGAMVYEYIPILGPIVKTIKGKLAEH